MDDENCYNTVTVNTTKPSLLFSNNIEMLKGRSGRKSVSDDDVESITFSTQELDRSLSSNGNTASEFDSNFASFVPCLFTNAQSVLNKIPKLIHLAQRHDLEH